MAGNVYLYISIMQTFHWYSYQLIPIDIARYLTGAIVDMLNEKLLHDELLFVHKFYNSIGSYDTIFVSCQLCLANWYDRIFECDIYRIQTGKNTYTTETHTVRSWL